MLLLRLNKILCATNTNDWRRLVKDMRSVTREAVENDFIRRVKHVRRIFGSSIRWRTVSSVQAIVRYSQRYKIRVHILH